MKTRPNILMITCHDLGQHLGCYGVDSVQTPNIDRLASRGMRFANAYSTSGVCSPARGSLHTGRYPQSNGLMGLTHAPWWWELKEAERHSAQILGELGHETYLIGLNHIDVQNPKRLGYEHVSSTNWVASETVADAVELIQTAQTRQRPFFAKVGFLEAHRPFTHDADDENGVFIPPWLQDTEDIRDDLAAFQAAIRYFDEEVGTILDTLEASEVAEDTLVIVTSDHGMPYPGAKWTVRKAGIEVPFIIFQPGTVFSGGKVVEELMSHVDVLPTMLDFVGADVPGNMQGHSLMPFVTGRADTAPRTAAFAQYTPDMKRDNLSRSIITDRYQLIRYFDQGRAVDYPVYVHPQAFSDHEQRCKTTGVRPFAQLFDIQTDPYELNDIGSEDEHAATVSELSARLLTWMQEVDDPLLEGPLRTPYYDRALADLLTTDTPRAEAGV